MFPPLDSVVCRNSHPLYEFTRGEKGPLEWGTEQEQAALPDIAKSFQLFVDGGEGGVGSGVGGYTTTRKEC